MIILFWVLLCFQQSILCTLADKDAWSGSWFPSNPYKPKINNDPWPGLWFPKSPFGNESDITNVAPKELLNTVSAVQQNQNRDTEQWKGLWFPAPPIELKSTSNCDDAQTNLGIDFDPTNSSHLTTFRCLGDRQLYAPKYQSHPILFTAMVPTAYRPMHRCMNESIVYTEAIPTFGSHRPIWPKYGEYLYVPPQRWLHSLEHGSIVMLYHPCADKTQVNLLRQIVTACVYRHIITAHEALTSDRPLALVGWGHRLEMSVVSAELAIQFISQHADRGLEMTAKNGIYDHMLIRPANDAASDRTTHCPTNVAYQ